MYGHRIRRGDIRRRRPGPEARDLLSDGRLDLIAGTGADVGGQFETYAVPTAERFGRAFEALQLIGRAFVEESFDHEGRYWRHPAVRMTTRPTQSPFPIWLCA